MFGYHAMRYFKRYWSESGSDEHNDWGCSWWLFETDETGLVMRQIEVYDRGPTLRDDRSHLTDEYGMLTDQPLDLADFAPYEVTRVNFEHAWAC